MTVCVTLSKVHGGRTQVIEPWLTTQYIIQRNLIVCHSCVSGQPLWIVVVDNEEYSTENHQLNKLQKMAVGSLAMSSEQTHVRKSFLGRISSVILRKLSSVLTTVWKTLQEKSVLQLYLEPFSQHTLLSLIHI